MARKQQQGAPAEGGGADAAPSAGVDPNVALFASYLKAEEAKERDAKKAARAERQQADEAAKLVVAKDAAAAEVKRLRGREGVSAEERAAADAAYRDALAAVVAAETGTAPAWAPPAPEPAEEPAATDDGDGAESRDEAPADAGDDAQVEVAPDGGDATDGEPAAPADETPADA